MKKVIQLCIILFLGVFYLIITAAKSITFNDLLFIIGFMCEILRIVLSIGGFILAYHHRYEKVNPKVTYMATTSLEHCILFVIGMKICFFLNTVTSYDDYAFYRWGLEVFQLGMVVIGRRYINESTDLKKWLIIQLALIGVVGTLMIVPFSVLNSVLTNHIVQLGSSIVFFIITFIVFFKCRPLLRDRDDFQESVFRRLIGIKIVISGLEVVKVIAQADWVLLLQYILQIFFIMWIVIYIDEYTLGCTWHNIESLVRSKRDQVAMAKDEQRILEIEAKEVQYHIEKIVGKVEQLEKQLRGKGQKSLEIIKSNSYRLLHLSNHILASTNECEVKIEPENFKQINLSKYVGDIIASIEPYIKEKGIELAYAASQKTIMVEVNQEAIERIVLNLVSNAVKYNKKDGHIQVILSEKKGYAYLCIKDSGIGISSDDLESIFEKFTRVETKEIKQQEGSGLGLSIVKSLVELHRGEIRVASTKGRGTIISIALPLIQEKL